jgi:hypothetical protein
MNIHKSVGIGALAASAVAGVAFIAFSPITVPTAALIGLGVSVAAFTSIYILKVGDSIANAPGDFFMNDLFGMWWSFDSEEDNVYIGNLMIATMFTQSTLKVDSTEGFVWKEQFKNVFDKNYKQVLNARKRFFAQHARYVQLRKLDGGKNYNVVNLKNVQSDTSEVDTSRFLNFYVDVSFIRAAMLQTNTTYNPVTGKMLNDYNSNRVKFLEDIHSGKYDKKK